MMTTTDGAKGIPFRGYILNTKKAADKLAAFFTTSLAVPFFSAPSTCTVIRNLGKASDLT